MREQEKLSDVAAELDLRYQQAEIINSVEVPYSERFWLAEEKFSVWFLPALALAAHFWFLCFLDWHYELGLAMALHITNSEVFELTACFTFMWLIFAPSVIAATISVTSMNNDWRAQRMRYVKQLEKAIDKANSLWDIRHGVRYTTVREYNDAILRQAKLAMGLEVPTMDELRDRRPVMAPPNPHIITLEMLGVEREEIRGASCMMPRI